MIILLFLLAVLDGGKLEEFIRVYQQTDEYFNSLTRAVPTSPKRDSVKFGFVPEHQQENAQDAPVSSASSAAADITPVVPNNGNRRVSLNIPVQTIEQESLLKRPMSGHKQYKAIPSGLSAAQAAPNTPNHQPTKPFLLFPGGLDLHTEVDGAPPPILPEFARSPSFIALLRPPSSYDPQSLMSHYGKSGRKIKDHHNRFWFGARYREHFMLGLIRCVLLANAIYCALFVLMFLPALLAADLSYFHVVVSILVTFAPATALLHMAGTVVDDFTLVASIRTMKNYRVVEQSLRRMATRFAFFTLKVVYKLIHGTHKDRQRTAQGQKSGFKLWLKSKRQRAPNSIHDIVEMSHVVNDEFGFAHAPSCAGSHLEKLETLTELAQTPKFASHSSAEDEEWARQIREAIEEETRAAAKESSERADRIWHEIFTVFDADFSGTISRHELKDSLKKMAPAGSLKEADLNYIANEIDYDKSGDI
jgi:hypothetical protein